jgi:uncharacterized protein with FMN-binding domain
MPNVSRTDRGGFTAVPRRGAVALVTTVLAVLLLFGFRTGDQPGLGAGRSIAAVIGPPGRAVPSPATGGVAPPTAPVTAVGGGGGTGATPAPGSPATGASETVTGDVIQTPYGNVQVAVVVHGHRIVDVQALQLPFERRLSAQISQAAEPLLRTQVLRAQNANISGVSGASYTSEGYFESLQSALAQIH